MLRDELKPRLAQLAAQGIYLGTSSWKYPGWCGSIYDEARYAYRNRFAKTRFEANCLAEYAETFSTVCVDAAYYQFPSPKYLEGLVAQVSPDFRFGLKVTDLVTIKKFPNLPRFGQHAGRPNENFLNADLFASAFLKPCEPFRPSIGTLIFEFSRFYSSDYAHGQDFVADLDRFLGALPAGWPYAIELRNRHWLQSDYFAMLARHNVAHAWNSWSAMPAASEQLALVESRTASDLAVARFLLKPGRTYEEAVKTFQPYTEVKDANADARSAAKAILEEGLAARKKTFIFINNRLEGSAPKTIAAILEALDRE